ncbi:MAG TPA: ABC transporter substrate-binding protein, partial [Deltaproteobacteria bacterium]|nr:ABC transporter substrate-binding protein [Deltaproteobacteria bacterium]
RVVGVSANVYKPPVFGWYAALDERIRRKQMPAPGNWDFISIEGVIALRPDVVIAWSAQSEAIAALEERGIKVFGVFLQSKEDVYREMIALGAMTGRQARAAELVAYTQAELARIARLTAPLPATKRPVVYYMWAQGPLETSCGGSTVDDLITLAGGRNACGAVRREHMLANSEQVLAWNPELIVMWGNDRLDPADIMADPRWRMVRAVKGRRVHELPEVFLCDLWTLKFAYAVKLLASWCHPQAFADLDVAAERRAMLAKLYGPKLGAFQ